MSDERVGGGAEGVPFPFPVNRWSTESFRGRRWWFQPNVSLGLPEAEGIGLHKSAFLSHGRKVAVFWIWPCVLDMAMLHMWSFLKASTLPAPRKVTADVSD